MGTQLRGTCWSVTINNPTQSDDEGIALARQKSGWKVYGQREKGALGTEHYQLMVTTPQVRFSCVKKSFPRAHIELARDRTALAKYVQKEDTKVGELDIGSEKYPSLQKLWDLLAEWIDDNQYSQRWYDAGPDQRLAMFDKFIGYLIEEDYVVETMGVNPQIRSCVKQYGENIYIRALHRQTDRQTAENIIDDQVITNGHSPSTSSSSSSSSSSTSDASSVRTLS